MNFSLAFVVLFAWNALIMQCSGRGDDCVKGIAVAASKKLFKYKSLCWDYSEDFQVETTTNLIELFSTASRLLCHCIQFLLTKLERIDFKFNFLAFISSGLFGGFLGESMYRYSYDMQTGTSHYRRNDGFVDSWTSPQRRGNEIRENLILFEIARLTGGKVKMHFRQTLYELLLLVPNHFCLSHLKRLCFLSFLHSGI